MSRIEKLLKAIINNTTYDEPRLSRIEEIFYSILYSLPYNANAQSRIEALLLALKESGLYDERTLSRIEEILKCKLDGRTYTGWIGSRVEMLLLEWELNEIIEATFTSFPIIIKANGEPLIDYTIYGNMSQSGTPTQETPIMPQGCGERTGNLCPITSFNKTTDVYYSILFNTPIPAGTYTFSAKITSTSAESRISFRKADMSQIISSNITIQTGRSQLTVTLNEPCYGMYIYGGTTVFDNIPIKYESIMLNTGSTALPYEPYGYKLTISSANTTTPVYLGEVETTRKIKKLVLTGEENWSFNLAGTNTDRYSMTLASRNLNQQSGLCTHFPFYASGIGTDTELVGCYNGLLMMRVKKSDIANATELKAWLAAQYSAGTPVTVWYVLAEPETGIVNEPLMKIGEYTDTLNMEQAGVSIPTLSKPNNTVIDVETTLKPSKMYVKYNGEGTRVYITSDSKLYITSNNEIYILKR